WKTRIAAFSLDTEPPQLSCPASVNQATDPGQCSAVVNYTVTAMDNCSAVTLMCAPPSGSIFAKGTTSVTCTASDVSSNSSTCTFPVIVQDKEPPQITCPAPIVQATDPGQCSALVQFTVGATDNCPGVTVACLPPSGTVFGKGTTVVSCKATDGAGNTSTCTFPVTIQDREPPHVTVRAGTNPAGKKAPGAGRNAHGGQNPDGFYQLLAQDNCDAHPKLYVR